MNTRKRHIDLTTLGSSANDRLRERSLWELHIMTMTSRVLQKIDADTGRREFPPRKPKYLYVPP